MLFKIFPSYLSKQKNKKVILELSNFMSEFYLNNVSSNKSGESLEQGLFEFRYNPENCHASNGLLLTNSGYFLTCKHCVDNNKKIFRKARFLDGEIGEIERICSWSSSLDLALGKFKGNFNNRTLKYRFNIDRNVIGIPTRLRTLKDGEIVDKYGIMSYKNISSVGAIPGDSGGVLTSGNNEIIGIVTGGDDLSFRSILTPISGVEKIIEAYLSNLS